jgi:hypothetical protein
MRRRQIRRRLTQMIADLNETIGRNSLLISVYLRSSAAKSSWISPCLRVSVVKTS